MAKWLVLWCRKKVVKQLNNWRLNALGIKSFLILSTRANLYGFFSWPHWATFLNCLFVKTGAKGKKITILTSLVTLLSETQIVTNSSQEPLTHTIFASCFISILTRVLAPSLELGYWWLKICALAANGLPHLRLWLAFRVLLNGQTLKDKACSSLEPLYRPKKSKHICILFLIGKRSLVCFFMAIVRKQR